MMHSETIPADLPPVTVEVSDGFSDVLDTLASGGAPSHAFLRAAWFGQDGEGKTIVARRADGTLIAAVPYQPLGHAIIGAGTVPGSYWPFRSALVAANATASELQATFAHPRLGLALLPMLRIGPGYRNDRAARALVVAARRAGWTVLERSVGQTFILDLTADRAWPRQTTRRRLTAYERKLGEHGDVSCTHIWGSDWSPKIIDTLAAIEARSWVGRNTDGNGAKFINRRERAHWERVSREPVLADMLSATILHVGDRAIAFSLDLTVGETQYAIASSFDADYAASRPGKLVTWRQFDRARARGVRWVDLGAGDSGYKREMGAQTGSEVIDRLFVRSRSAAALLRLKWTSEDSPLLPEPRFGTREGTQFQPRHIFNNMLVAGGIAAAALALTE